jgi:hypothetical protein
MGSMEEYERKPKLVDQTLEENGNQTEVEGMYT